METKINLGLVGSEPRNTASIDYRVEYEIDEDGDIKPYSLVALIDCDIDNETPVDVTGVMIFSKDLEQLVIAEIRAGLENEW